MGSEGERRAYSRYDADGYVRVRLAGSKSDGLPCRLLDVGRGGVAVMSLHKPQGHHIEIEILTSEGQAIGGPVQAEIAYVEEVGQAGYRVGCRFEVPQELLLDRNE